MATTQRHTTTHDIIKTARFLFDEQGFDQTTMQDIATRLEVSVATVVASFSTIDDLLEAVWSE